MWKKEKHILPVIIIFRAKMLRANILSDIKCKCGLDIEDYHNFFLDFPFYLIGKGILFNTHDSLSCIPEYFNLELYLFIGRKKSCWWSKCANR